MMYKLPTELSVSQKGIDFIKKYETFIPKAFWDYKQWSIGYGTKAKHKDEVIDEPEALRRLKEETEKFQTTIRKYVKVPVTQNMYDALVSFTFNVGGGWMINGSSVFDALKKRFYGLAANNMLKWNRAGGKVLKGLDDRRKAESKLFLTDM